MPRGGARIHSGPPPDPNALRRDRDKADWIHLPPLRSAPAPDWPLTKATAREAQLWAEEWRRPQAVIWEAAHQEREVALYIRALRDAEMPKATVASRTLVRQFMDELGLSQSGLRRNRWIIDVEPEQRQVARTHDPDRASARSRLTSIEGGAAG